MCRGQRVIYGILSEPVRLRSVCTQTAVCDLESMCFRLCPIVQNTTYDSRFVHTASGRLNLEPRIRRLCDRASDVFERDAHGLLVRQCYLASLKRPPPRTAEAMDLPGGVLWTRSRPSRISSPYIPSHVTGDPATIRRAIVPRGLRAPYCQDSAARSETPKRWANSLAPICLM